MFFHSWDPKAYAEFGFGLTAAALLAVEHFNERNPLIVKELPSLVSCPVQFTDLSIIDSKFHSGAVFDEMVDRIRDDQLPCAVMGPFAAQQGLEVQKLLGRLDIPQLLYSSFETGTFDRRNPSVMTTSVSQDTLMDALIDLYSFETPTPSIFAITGPQNEESFPAKYLSVMVGETIRTRREDAKFIVGNFRDKAIQEFKESGYRILFISYENVGIIEDLVYLLDESGLLTEDYQYVVPNTALMYYRQSGILEKLQKTDSLYKFLNGVLSVDMLDGFDQDLGGDRFLRAWQSLDDSFTQRVLRLAPPGLDKALFGPLDVVFQRKRPVQLSSYVYDNIMALGFGACHLLESKEAYMSPKEPPPPQTDMPPKDGPREGSPPDVQPRNRALQSEQESEPKPPSDKSGGSPPPFPPPPELPIMKAVRNVTFSGATGIVDFGWRPQPYSRIFRQPSHSHVGLYQVQPDKSTGLLKIVLVKHWDGETNWSSLTGRSLQFRDGSSDLVNGMPVAVDFNYLSTSVRIFGLALMSFSWLLAIVAIAMISVYRQKRNVRASQPFFMILLCVGALVTSSTIFTLSFDENAGWTDSQLDFACSTAPWLFFLGQIIGFSAIFTKLIRVDRVMQFRRQAVLVRHVVGPLLTLLLLALGFLVTWTLVDPWTWERRVIREIPLETHGECTNENFWIYFGPLMALLVCAQVATGFYTWKTMDVASQFRDPEVLYVLLTNTQAWALGVPLLSTMDSSSSDATYLGRVFLISVFGLSSVGFIVIPKVFGALKREAVESRVHVSGLNKPSTSTSTVLESSGNHLRRPVSKDSMVSNQSSRNFQGKAELLESPTPSPPESSPNEV